MKKEKTYNQPDEPMPVVAEPIAAYGCVASNVQTLRSRIVDAVNRTEDEDRLMECMEMLYADTMPCVYTDEEFEKVLEESEKSGTITHEEVLKYFIS